MQKKSLIFFIVFIVFVSGFIIAESSFFDVFFDIDKLDDLEELCVKDCKKMNTEACNDLYEDGKDACKDIQKNQMDQCRSLPKKEQELCKHTVNNDYRDCVHNAQENKKECRKDLKEQKEQCRLECKINVCTIINQDSDHDGVIDIKDNCPHTPNPDQTDSNENGIGDACENIEVAILCCTTDLLGQCFETSIAHCREQGGAVMDCLPQEGTGDDVIVSTLKNFTGVSFNATDSALVNLSKDVISTRVNDSNYSLGVYDCRNFAHDLERNLTTLGYNATWTAYWCYGGVGNPPTTAHAVTDVHLADGRTVFIEPQNNQIINLDFDGDGQVEVNNNGYVPGANMGQTDDNCKISVFEDRAAATAAGVPGA